MAKNIAVKNNMVTSCIAGLAIQASEDAAKRPAQLARLLALKNEFAR